jgi:AcrR family transcriptional regulator
MFLQVAIAETDRRTQEERRATTRAALLDAAIECLVEHGYAGTTTGRVCERAGLSRGAVGHHFHTRPELVVAALRELASRRAGEMIGEAERLPPGSERVERALDLLWSWFNGPLFHAAVDVAVAARTDPELSSTLESIERELGRETLRCCRGMFATDEADPVNDQLIQMSLATIRGLALLPVLQPGSRPRADKQWAFARTRLAELFAAATPTV